MVQFESCESILKKNRLTSLPKSFMEKEHQSKISISHFLITIFCILAVISQGLSVMAGCQTEQLSDCETICTYSNSSSNYNCTITAAVLLPRDEKYIITLSKVMPVLYLAEKHIKEVEILPSYISFNWITYDDKCDASYATISAMNAHGKNCSHVFFGPACDYALASVSRIIKYFHSEGTPLISVGGLTYNFEEEKKQCKNEFYMLIRAGLLSFTSISEFILSIMNTFNWNNAVYIVERNAQETVAGEHTCHLMMSTLAWLSKKENFTYSSYNTEPEKRNLTEELKREIGNQHSIEANGSYFTKKNYITFFSIICNLYNNM